MHLVEFAYIRIIHCSTRASPFEVVYSFNPLTPLDLVPISTNDISSLDFNNKVEMMRKIPWHIATIMEHPLDVTSIVVLREDLDKPLNIHHNTS